MLDAGALERLRALDPAGDNRLVERVLSAFHASLSKLLPRLVDARGRDDVAGVRYVAHTLKSSAASIGAERLSRLCAEVEQALRHRGLTGLDESLDDLTREAELVRDALVSKV